MSNNLKSAFSAALSQFKNQFIPTKDANLRMTWGGAIAVPDSKNDGFYIVFEADGKIKRYPAAMTMKVPVFFINRSLDQIKPGDVIRQGYNYYNVQKVKGDKIATRSYTGFTSNILPIEDVLIGTTGIPVAINLFGAFGNGQTNPMANLGNAFGGLFGNNGASAANPFGNMMNMMLLSRFIGDGECGLFGSDDSDKDLDDEFTSMDRRELKLYQQRNNLGVKVFPSMSDEDLRNAIRKKLGRKTSSDSFGGDTMSMLIMSQVLGGGQVNGMNPLALMLLSDGNGGDKDDLMLLLMMSQMGNLQAMNNNAPAASAAPAEGPVEIPVPESTDVAEDAQ